VILIDKVMLDKGCHETGSAIDEEVPARLSL
jgi:hypothetical protein